MSDQKNTLFTIGYGKRKIDEFISLLRNYGIKFLADLRSKPYSKYNPDFSQKRLEAMLAEQGIKYVFMGDTLGGLPTDTTCYTDGRVDYTKVQSKDFYLEGIDRLKSAYEQKVPLALMCSEGKPHQCHRSKLVGATLSSYHININHIDENGLISSQEEVLSKLRSDQISFFGDDPLYSRKVYLPTEEK